jgi:Cysteine rich repeat
MRQAVKCLLIVALLCLLPGTPGTSRAQEDLLASVKEGCQKELDSFCKGVTPGEGRVLSCLYAYEDKLSGRCEYALYDASAQLEHAIAALTYVAKECEAELGKHCADVKAGEGRLAACLKKNEKELSARCKNAMKDVKLQ